MNDDHLTGLDDIEKFLVGTQAIDFKPRSTIACYEWLARTLKRFNYFALCKRDKGTVRRVYAENNRLFSSTAYAIS